MKFSLVHNIIKTYFEVFIISWLIFLVEVLCTEDMIKLNACINKKVCKKLNNILNVYYLRLSDNKT